jgi:hypothetical protein
MARGKGQAWEFIDAPDIKITWGPHGRFTIKKDRISNPVGFLAPRNFEWQLQKNPSLKPIGDPIKDRSDALLAAALHFTDSPNQKRLDK